MPLYPRRGTRERSDFAPDRRRALSEAPASARAGRGAGGVETIPNFRGRFRSRDKVRVRAPLCPPSRLTWRRGKDGKQALGIQRGDVLGAWTEPTPGPGRHRQVTAGNAGDPADFGDQELAVAPGSRRGVFPRSRALQPGFGAAGVTTGTDVVTPC